jgi:hypothetical protein
VAAGGSLVWVADVIKFPFYFLQILARVFQCPGEKAGRL